MTSLIAWLAVDDRVPTAVYFASDGRRSWADGSFVDDCIKVFAPKDSQDILAFAGDTLFPSRILPLLCKEIENKSIPPGLATSMFGRSDWIYRYLTDHLRTSPVTPMEGFTIIHGSRNGFGMTATFSLFSYIYLQLEQAFSAKEITFQIGHSSLIKVLGSGVETLTDEVRIGERAIGEYSRIYFSAFCRALESGNDICTGGSPQLVGLGNKGSCRHFGVITDTGTYFRGRPVSTRLSMDVQWRNAEFERVDQDGNLLHGAQRHARERRKMPAGKS